MPIAIALAEPDIFAVRASGDVTYDECQRAIDDLIARAANGAARRILVDARGVTGTPSTAELRAIASDLRPLVRKGVGPMAIVSDQVFVYGVARMFAVFAEVFGIEVQAFRDVDEASAWLNRDRPSPAA